MEIGWWIYAGDGVFVTSANCPLINYDATFLVISLIAFGTTPSSSRIMMPPLYDASGCKNILSSGFDPGNGFKSPWFSILWRNKFEIVFDTVLLSVSYVSLSSSALLNESFSALLNDPLSSWCSCFSYWGTSIYCASSIVFTSCLYFNYN